MEKDNNKMFIYHFAHREGESSMCKMEKRSIFGIETNENVLKSPIEIDPNRSPFIKERIEVMYEGADLQDIINQVKKIFLFGLTFNVNLMKYNNLYQLTEVEDEKRGWIAHEVGLHINGKLDRVNPDQEFGITVMDGRWYFGRYKKSKTVWIHHSTYMDLKAGTVG
ncbi:hypothetical protein [Jeotgalibacillus soli]|uniref:RNA methyltransferase n=1 Tax=Jeotgalibacillus soli TaxID=889306 RepID=A0A0C2RRF6_9BACL|nr:hypothetical protein [Jeotgalibacillus soli]KIL44339.1 RNA methyltransferase [Jeotgalibacillus soli]